MGQEVWILSLMEVLVVPKRRRAEDLCQRYRDFFQSFPNLEVRPIDAQVAETASDLRAEYGLRTLDALHMATALTASAKGFLTEDRGIKDVPGLLVQRFDATDF